MSSSMDVRIKNIEKGNTKECPLIISNGRSDPTDINDITAPQTVVKSDTYSDVVSRCERRELTGTRRMEAEWGQILTSGPEIMDILI